MLALDFPANQRHNKSNRDFLDRLCVLFELAPFVQNTEKQKIARRIRQAILVDVGGQISNRFIYTFLLIIPLIVSFLEHLRIRIQCQE